MLSVCIGLLANKPHAKGLWTTCKKVFLTCEPLAKGFGPLSKDFALLANHLWIIFTKTCKQTNLLLLYFGLHANKPICKVGWIVYVLTNQLNNDLLWFTC